MASMCHDACALTSLTQEDDGQHVPRRMRALTSLTQEDDGQHVPRRMRALTSLTQEDDGQHVPRRRPRHGDAEDDVEAHLPWRPLAESLECVVRRVHSGGAVIHLRQSHPAGGREGGGGGCRRLFQCRSRES